MGYLGSKLKHYWPSQLIEEAVRQLKDKKTFDQMDKEGVRDSQDIQLSISIKELEDVINTMKK